MANRWMKLGSNARFRPVQSCRQRRDSSSRDETQGNGNQRAVTRPSTAVPTAANRTTERKPTISVKAAIDVGEGDPFPVTNRGKLSANRIKRNRKSRDIPHDGHDLEVAAMDINDRTLIPDSVDVSDEEYDFEVEDPPDAPTPTSLMTKSQKMYIQACRYVGVVPSSIVLQTIDHDEMSVENHNLGELGTKACAIALVSNHVIKSINLEGNGMGASGAAYICEMLRENLFITEVTLAENSLKSAGARAIANTMRENTSITYLNVSGNDFEEKDAIYFADILQNNRSLHELNLSHNCFSEKGGMILGPAIGNNDVLEVLDLSWNHLRRKGAVAVVKGLKENVSLKRLDLSWNGLHLEGSRELGKALQVNCTLKDLNITCNRIDFLCLSHVLKGIKANEGLCRLQISDNPIKTEGALALLQTIMASKMLPLEFLDISSQTVDGVFVRTLDRVRETRPNLHVKYGYLLRQDEAEKPDEIDLSLEDPMMVLMEFMRLKNLRLVDLFISLDKDGSMSLTRQEFKKGLKSVNIPLPERSLDMLVDKLDADGDHEVDYKELIDGQKKHKRRMAKLMSYSRDLPPEENSLFNLSKKLITLMKATNSFKSTKQKEVNRP